MAGDGAEGIYYHDGKGSYTNANQEAGDNSYRYAGANPDNYVCFGTDAETCPNDNLYRIIGVFDNQVKLIKNTSIESNYWRGSTLNKINTWGSSKLNANVLNVTYYNALGSTWTSKIANHTWIVGGNTIANMVYYPEGLPKKAYRNEIENPAESTTHSAKIGLMYVSDYYYGASPRYWTYPGYTTSSYPDANGNYGSSYDYRAAINSNWMSEISEWTITRRSDTTDNAFYLSSPGFVYGLGVDHSLGIRPSFYLKSDVTLTGGTGTSADPYRIA